MRSPSATSSSSSSRAAAAAAKRGQSRPSSCCTKLGLKRGPWTAEEDELLSRYVTREGEGRWRTLPKKAGLLRCGKSCRLRWMNYLRPSVKRGRFSSDEVDLILRLHRLLGNRWSLIAGRIPGRTDNEIKNYWNTHLSKKLLSQGIDPKSHKPLLPPNPNPCNNGSRDPNCISIPFTDKSNILLDDSSCGEPFHGVTLPIFDSVPDQLGEAYDDVNTSTHDHHHFFGEEGFKKLDVLDEGIISCNEDRDMKINVCQDDAFSSFLNSLINDDMFNLQQEREENDLQNDHHP